MPPIPPNAAAGRPRLIALGASNLTRGFGHLVAAAQQQAKAPIEVFAALGHGRSYGIASSLLWRTLPGIDGCGLWDALAQAPSAPATGIVMDVGNDLLYGVEVDTILAWVERALQRLRPAVERLVVVAMPMPNLRRLSAWRYVLVRSILFPRCRTPLGEMQHLAERLDAGLAQLAQQYGAVLQVTRPEWYGLDPIHVRSRHWPQFARELLDGSSTARCGWRHRRLLLTQPAQRWRWGRERLVPQPSVRWPDGSALSLW